MRSNAFKTPFMDHSWVTAKGLAQLSETMSHAMQALLRWVIVKSSDKMWSTEGGKGNLLQYSCLENPMDGMKRQKDMTLEDGPPRSEGVQYATGEEQTAITNSSRKSEVAGPKQK